MNKGFGNVQRVGKALMTPVAALPVAALLLRLGQPDVFNIPIISAAGGALFNNLALLFAIGVGFGLAKSNQGAAGLAGAIGYLVIKDVTTAINPKINMGVLAGMIAGIMAGVLYNKFHDIKLPDWLGFFGGKRFVPIVTSLCALVLGVLFGYIWPPIQLGIDSLGTWIISAGALGAGVFGFLNRLLIPVGLHHVLNSFLWFIFGEYGGATGDLSRFFAGDPTAGTFMAGFYPVMMFGLPAVALAMYTTAKKENRAAVGGMLFSVAFTSFLTGITEPIEFMFMFLAPVLYFVHAVLTGISLAVVSSLGILHGFGFSAGAIDYFLNFGLATKAFLLIPVGLIFGAIYYVVFVFVIKKLDLQTPGRGENESGNDELIEELGISNVAFGYVNALGGKENIIEVDACITRLRMTLKTNDKVDEEALKKLGASGSIKPSNTNIQVIVGTKAELIAEEMKQILG
ncbi:N-acetylglucosamine-specific PTS transporter subunit IIBC [Fusibacter ferrireducens]|uniref:PTS transporter subunit EIIC n=1 Tax=Fusibacter ferrireducens TaxID=2785058 RepID=A0ABR9ZTI9_9FIRM|nr:N-acetylglucosamine-specific PTS transporter subunit IIBC [Fusibacter ferrireducens]MBF4693804.1 PTS transporter subunit EIIC [Fusibacter ferrireducens]